MAYAPASGFYIRSAIAYPKPLSGSAFTLKEASGIRGCEFSYYSFTRQPARKADSQPPMGDSLLIPHSSLLIRIMGASRLRRVGLSASIPCAYATSQTRHCEPHWGRSNPAQGCLALLSHHLIASLTPAMTAPTDAPSPPASTNSQTRSPGHSHPPLADQLRLHSLTSLTPVMTRNTQSKPLLIRPPACFPGRLASPHSKPLLIRPQAPSPGTTRNPHSVPYPFFLPVLFS
jgi:hypothetical protein